VVVVIVVLVYFNSWFNPFILDDATHIRDNPGLREWENWTAIFKSPFFEFPEAGLAQYYRPLTILTYKVEYLLFAENPFGFHLVNTAFHCLNTILVFLLCRLIGGYAGPAFIISLLFGIHPLQTEEVSYISGLGGLAAGSAVLSSAYFFLRFLKEKNRLYYLSSIFLFVLGLFYKEGAMIAPFLLFWLTIASGRGQLSGGGRWRAALLYLPVFFLILGGYLFLRSSIVVPADFFSGLGGGLGVRFLTFGKGLWVYLRLAFFPLHLHFYRSLELIYPGWYPLALLILGSCVLFLVRLTVRGERSTPLISVGAGWFVIGLSPFFGGVPIILEGRYLYWAEHFMYLPLIGIWMVLAGALFELLNSYPDRRTLRAAVGGCLLLLVISFAFLTVRQNSFWSDELIFFRRMARHEPRLFRTTGMLGVAYFNKGMWDKAIVADTEARKKLLDLSEARSEAELPPMDKYMLKTILIRMAQSYYSLGNTARSREIALELQRFFPDNYIGYYISGWINLKSGDSARALTFLEEAYRLNPSDFKTARALIRCYQRLNNFQRSREVWREAAERIPAFREAREILKRRNQK